MGETSQAYVSAAGSKTAPDSVRSNTGLALLRIAGPDATRFLNAQTTAAFDDDTGRIRFAALADPKGRVLAVFHAWRGGDGWLLAVAASEAEWLAAHLARFVLRARVTIAPAPELRLLGLIGKDASTEPATAGLPVPVEQRIEHRDGLTVVALAGGRRLIVGAEEALAPTERTSRMAAATSDVWKRARLAAGEIEIRAETRSRFLPQMLGLVERDAVSFRKGCYPGQEIIARAEHRGRVKRALALLRLDLPPAAGTNRELDGARLEVLDSVALPAGGALVQAVAPHPLPPALAAHLFKG